MKNFSKFIKWLNEKKESYNNLQEINSNLDINLINMLNQRIDYLTEDFIILKKYLLSLSKNNDKRISTLEKKIK